MLEIVDVILLNRYIAEHKTEDRLTIEFDKIITSIGVSSFYQVSTKKLKLKTFLEMAFPETGTYEIINKHGEPWFDPIEDMMLTDPSYFLESVQRSFAAEALQNTESDNAIKE